jgi:hypothetical protein
VNVAHKIRSLVIVGAVSAMLSITMTATAQTFLGTHGGRDWYLTDESLTPTDARNFATSEGGFLATIRDQEELDWVRAAGVTQLAWIGLTDIAVEGDFVWDDGDASTFQFWAPGEPNSAGDEDNVVVNWATDGGYNDWQWDATAQGLYTVAVVPEPATLIAIAMGCSYLAAKRRRRS